MIRIRVLLVITLFALAPSPCHAQKAILIVRHAEKADNSMDPPLSAPGRARAKTLAKLLRDANISAIYTSEFRRATQTAEPLASQLGVLIRREFMSGSGDFVKLLHQRHPDGVVLVVGHSNTVVDLLVALGHNPSPPIQIDEEEFDNIFVVMPRENTSPTVIRLRYGR